ncbi:MAG: hypothetical protein PUB24_00365 [Lachnospiraceae bacterium]|nr:hypothetical protein [Lachnospiraceae bacterium]
MVKKIVIKIAIGVIMVGLLTGGLVWGYHFWKSMNGGTTNQTKETKQKNMTEEQNKNKTSKETYEAYRGALEKFLSDNIYPDGEIAEGGLSDPNSGREWYLENGQDYDTSAQFAIADIDMDGQDELNIFWNGYYMYTIGTRTFSYDDEKDSFVYEGNPGATYDTYDNGINLARALHSNYGGEMVTISKYNGQVGKLEEIGSYVEILKEYWDLYSQDESYPENLDTDGEGRVYHIDCGDYHGVYSVEDFNKFLKELIGDAKQVELGYVDLDEDNINKIIDEKIQEIKEQ